MLRRATQYGFSKSGAYVCMRCHLRQNAVRFSVPHECLASTRLYSSATPSSDEVASETTSKDDNATKSNITIRKHVWKGPNRPKQERIDGFQRPKTGGRRRTPRIRNPGDTLVRKISPKRSPQRVKGSRRLPRRGNRLPPVTKSKPEPGSFMTLKEAMQAGIVSAKALKELPNKLTAKDAPVLKKIRVPQPPVHKLAHGLDRVLFNPGFYQLRDPRSRVFNFDPYLEKLMPVNEFDFDTITQFMPPSKDPVLVKLAAEQDKKYVSSTSSMTGILKHLHFLISKFRPINFNMLSSSFKVQSHSFTKLSRAPDAVFLRYRDGRYAVDADKFYDTPNVLSLMGKYMEKLLTLNAQTFENHRIGKSDKLDPEVTGQPESFHYSTQGDFILRSQLDAYDPRLPGTGMYDLKTRAVLPIRMDTQDFEWGMGYELRSLRGDYESYERELHDMIRATMLKYSLQVRMGRMDGIFVAYHNIKRIFGFQYISLPEMDLALHGQQTQIIGDKEFEFSLKMLNLAFDMATQEFPETSIRMHFEARDSTDPFMYIFAEPMGEEDIQKIQTANSEKIKAWEKSVMGSKAPVEKEYNYDIDQEITSVLVQDQLKASQQEETSDVKSSAADAPTADNDAAPQPEAEVQNSPMPESEPEKPSGPLLAFLLRVRSTVHGKPVIRVHNIQDPMDWELEYGFTKVEKGERAWALYEACKARRAKEFANVQRERRETDKRDYYLDLLKRLTSSSRSYREELDRKDAGQKEVLYRPIGPRSAPSLSKNRSGEQGESRSSEPNPSEVKYSRRLALKLIEDMESHPMNYDFPRELQRPDADPDWDKNIRLKPPPFRSTTMANEKFPDTVTPVEYLSLLWRWRILQVSKSAEPGSSMEQWVGEVYTKRLGDRFGRMLAKRLKAKFYADRAAMAQKKKKAAESAEAA